MLERVRESLISTLPGNGDSHFVDAVFKGEQFGVNGSAAVTGAPAIAADTVHATNTEMTRFVLGRTVFAPPLSWVYLDR